MKITHFTLGSKPLDFCFRFGKCVFTVRNTKKKQDTRNIEHPVVIHGDYIWIIHGIPFDYIWIKKNTMGLYQKATD